jgi:Ca-activated chloride channel family protein
MQKSVHLKQLLLLLFAVSVSGIFTLAQAEEKDKTLSPYFHVNSTEPSVDKLPLKHTEAEVNIAGVIADVKVRQVYVNEGEGPIEAIYVFPGSTRAAVYGMKMTIGERVLNAKIQKKEDARQTYEAAKAEGKTASLLEQHRPNVFQMNVANILRGDTVIVELSYT